MKEPSKEKSKLLRRDMEKRLQERKVRKNDHLIPP